MTEPSVEIPAAEPEVVSGEIRNDHDAIKAVEALLGTPSAPEPETVPNEPTVDEMPTDLAGLAEKLKATPDKLYSLKVPMADGESRTLGELKDGYRAADQLRAERETFHVERTRLDTDKRQALQDLEQIVRRLPPETLTNEAIAAVHEARSLRLQGELEQLLKAVPEWRDAVRYTAEKPLIEAYASQYGYSPADLADVTDHKILRALRGGALAAEQSKAERVKPPVKVAQAPKAGKAPSQAQEHGRLKAAVTMRRMQPADAVAQLLKGM